MSKKEKDYQNFADDKSRRKKDAARKSSGKSAGKITGKRSDSGRDEAVRSDRGSKGKGKKNAGRNFSDEKNGKREESMRQRHGIEKIEWSQEERERTQSAPVFKHKLHKNSSSQPVDRSAQHRQEWSQGLSSGSRHQGRQDHGRYGRKYGNRNGRYLGYQEDERGAVEKEELQQDAGMEQGAALQESGTADAAYAEHEDSPSVFTESPLLPEQDRIPGDEADEEEEYTSGHIEGRNAVTEAFRAGKTIDRLYLLENCDDGPIMTIRQLAARAGTPVRFVTRQRLDQMSQTGSHQGVIANVAAYHYGTLDDLFQRAQQRNEDPFFIILDNIEDPYNLGAILRTANVAGAHGVIIAKDRAVGLTATVAKASAGAINYTPVVRVTNISQTIIELKKKGLWFVCADMDGQPMTKLNLAGPIGLVIGAEGAGVSRLVKENCDIVAAIPQHGEINSLNASVAAGILTYEILRQRMK